MQELKTYENFECNFKQSSNKVMSRFNLLLDGKFWYDLQFQPMTGQI